MANIDYDSTRFPVIKLDFKTKNLFLNKKTDYILIYNNQEIQTFKSDGDNINNNITKLNG